MNKTAKELKKALGEKEYKRLYNKNGELKKYSLACGYIQIQEQDGIRIHLCQETCFHVSGYDHKNMKRLFWNTYDSDQLTLARKDYWKQINKYFNNKEGKL